MPENDVANNVTESMPANSKVSRREFVVGAGALGVGAVLGGTLVGTMFAPSDIVIIPASEGYLLVDTKKCATCASCMLACSMAHHGRSSLSLSRIQVLNDPLGKYPDDVTQYQCRQCPYPACVEACPTGANHIDSEAGNVRTVDEAKCIGCERCVRACPFTPSRMQWNFEDRHAQKCDLCADTPFWDEKGGPTGKQLCMETCPHHAISFTQDVPIQSGDGYVVNLRSKDAWGRLGFPIDDEGMVLLPPVAKAPSAH